MARRATTVVLDEQDIEDLHAAARAVPAPALHPPVPSTPLLHPGGPAARLTASPP
ncbi:MAG: hypothetical protein ACRDY3_12545 [Acidimicrobiales bacterium]